ncbi:MAG TPA: allantoate amidohydrolase [Cryptosporangiaceae bacterium]|nr:allantoate amidohydrolase [Cryptosporangiaceae bacterium]
MSTFDGLWDELLPVGRDPRTGGYRRFAYGDAELACREWFTGAAIARGLDVVPDRAGNLWAWWGDPDADGPGLVLGSHLDSVPDGGAYDGPLGVVSAFAALDALRADGMQLARPVAVAAFADEEGARFGIACAGSRLVTGGLAAERALALTDVDGVAYAEAVRRAGLDPTVIGRDDEALARIGTFVELHVEQGQGLVETGAPVGVGSTIWPHGRWRFSFTGRPDHAGTTRMDDRHDPMLTYAMTALAANKQARLLDARATFGRVEVDPNATNAIPSQVRAWLDARAPEQSTLDDLVANVRRLALERADRDGTSLAVHTESVTPLVEFDAALRDRLAMALGGGVPVLPTAAGHDAGVLAAAGVPTAMLFVRNPTGVSHAPDEHAERDDCLAGVRALAGVVTELAGVR